jgi:isoquinoline 1-oxidoreductase alpha subunit
MTTLNVNGTNYTVEADLNTPVLWVLRDIIGLTGTKYSCGIGVCGACMVLLDGKLDLACQRPVSDVGQSVITTIEGLSPDGTHPLQLAWIAHQVPQCGWCQAGQIMAATQLIANGNQPSDADITADVVNICFCGTYSRIRAAIHTAAGN